MAKKGRVVLAQTPTVYEIGVDITPEQWTELVMNVGDWLAETRKGVKEPNVLARQMLEACLKGVKPSDPTKQWVGVENSAFATRVRIACRFDMATMAGIRNPSEKNKVRKEKEKQRLVDKRKKQMDDPNIPDEIRKDLKKSAKYGDDPRVHLSTAEHKYWQELKDGYIASFPELAGINAEAGLHLLCDLLVLSQRQRMNVLEGKDVNTFDQKSVTDQIVQLQRALNIHPEQVAKRVEKQTGGTVGELVRRFEELPNWRELRLKYWAEELLQTFQMFVTPSPREDLGGYQLDEVGLFGLTSARPCYCPKCGHRQFAGLSMDEIEAWLVEQEHLTAREIAVPPPAPIAVSE